MNAGSFAILMAVIMAGYNGILLLTGGMLLMFTDQMTAPGGWSAIGGFLLVLLGTACCIGIYGMLSGRDWGRQLMRFSFLFCIPLNIAAVFPIFQNHRMTTGNTILQVTCIIVSCLSASLMNRQHAHQRNYGALMTIVAHDARDETVVPTCDEAFTFDRKGRADRV